jgi:type IV pilus assembly protein PilY1
VYPATVGAIAQKIYIGDADGTVWRFDLSSTDPTKWKGELFFDTFNQTSYSGSNAAKDGQPIAVQPVVALDRSGNLVVEIATGDQETFTPAGTNFVWSLTERFNSAKNKLLSSVNWYIPFGPTDGSACISTSECGKKVSGPMAVFDGVFYFATFNPAATSAVCSGGTPEVYGRDFVVPRDTSSLKKGGDLRLIDPTSGPPPTTLADPSYSPAAAAGSVIPGLSINVPPTCADTKDTITDPYTGQTHYTTTSVNPNPPSLVGQYGKSGTSGAATAVSIQLTQPKTATVVDSWAAVVE